MNKHDVGIAQRAVEVERGEMISVLRDTRHQARGLLERSAAAVLQGIDRAPGVFGFVYRDAMAAPHQLAANAAQEMGVAGIPAGAERMIEQQEIHGRTAQAARASAETSTVRSKALS